MENAKFCEFTMAYFAELLGISTKDVLKLYEFVNTHFYIEVTDSKAFSPNKPRRFTARLIYSDPREYGEDHAMCSFGDGKDPSSDEFLTVTDAVKTAYQRISTVEFTRGSVVFEGNKWPYNMLVLFDKNYERSIDPLVLGELIAEVKKVLPNEIDVSILEAKSGCSHYLLAVKYPPTSSVDGCDAEFSKVVCKCHSNVQEIAETLGCRACLSEIYYYPSNRCYRLFSPHGGEVLVC